MWEHLDIWLLLAGLGIFLFGIHLIEDSIATLSGRTFKRLVREGTSTTLRAIFSGIAATALLQSSSAVTLMVLAFVGAGMVTLAGGIGVVLGSNIGTTATSWIVATIGFKLDIEQLALPLIGIGGLILIFLGRSPRYSQISHLLVGFGFLFLGLDNMKDSVSAFADDLDPAILVNAPAWAFIVMGVVLTAAMQSSSATVAILLTALHAGLFDLREGAFAIIGTNVGTTITVFLGALGGTVVKKRLAWSHLSFNVFSALIALAALPFYLRIIGLLLGEDHDPIIGLAMFHTLFNLVGVLAIVPAIHHFRRLVEKIVPEDKMQLTLYIGETSPLVPEAAAAGVQKEVRQLLVETLAFHQALLEMEAALVLPEGARSMRRDRGTFLDHYDHVKRLQAEIITYVTEVEKNEMAENESRSLNRAVHAARLALYSAKALKDVKRNIDAFADSGGFPERFHGSLRKRAMATHMRIGRLMEPGVVKDPTTELASLLRQLDVDDDSAMKEVNLATRNAQLRDMDLSSALLVNRALAGSTRDLIFAVAEITLTPEEFHTLERVREVEEALHHQP